MITLLGRRGFDLLLGNDDGIVAGVSVWHIRHSRGDDIVVSDEDFLRGFHWPMENRLPGITNRERCFSWPQGGLSVMAAQEDYYGQPIWVVTERTGCTGHEAWADEPTRLPGPHPVQVLASRRDDFNVGTDLLLGVGPLLACASLTCRDLFQWGECDVQLERATNRRQQAILAEFPMRDFTPATVTDITGHVRTSTVASVEVAWPRRCQVLWDGQHWRVWPHPYEGGWDAQPVRRTRSEPRDTSRTVTVSGCTYRPNWDFLYRDGEPTRSPREG